MGARDRIVAAGIAALALVTLAACGDPETPPPVPPALDEEVRVPEEPQVRPLPEETPGDPARIALGERLFADPRLSRDGTVACTACHDLADGGDAGNARTALPGREPGPINVPTVLNLRYQFRWSWTGRWTRMADQIDAAMRAPHSLDTEPAAAVERVRPHYAADFARAYPGTGLTLDTFHDALETYLVSLTTPDAPFDRYLTSHDPSAMAPDALAGWELFQSYGCVSCHQGMNIGGNMFQRFGVMEDYFARPGREALPSDRGRAAITNDEADLHVFRVPSLRNVALTAPYFHDGSAATLEEAVHTMGRYQLARELDDDEVRRLVAFLRSLTGRQPGSHEGAPS